MSMRPEEAGAEGHFAAWLLRVEGGEEPSFEALLAEHAELADELRRLHEDWRLFAPLLGRAVPGRIDGEQGIVLAPLSGTSAEAGEPASAELLERLGIEVPQSGRYRFRAVIGRGGGGIVLRVWDAKLNRALAMKVVLGRGEERPTGTTPKVDGLTLTRFVDEARIASQLNHPGIVPVHELGLDETGRAFFTMKLVKGEDLAKVFEHVKTGHDGWSQTRALNVLLRVCESVAFAHEKGVIHRDLKPANVMVGRHGEVYVMDWGLARVLGEPDRKDVRVRPPAATSALHSLRARPSGETPDSPLYTMDGDVVGTPAYMAPEQAAGELSRMGPHSDVYALGAMLYHLLAGHMPYVLPGTRWNNYALWQRVQEGPPERIEKLAPRTPAELAAICEKAMAREIGERYPDVPALARDLRAFLENRVVAAYETGAWAETRKWVRRNSALASSLLAVLVVSAVGVLVSMTNARRADVSARTAEANARQAAGNFYFAAVIGAAAARAIGEPHNARYLLSLAPADLRDWEWHYLDSVSDSSLHVLQQRGDISALGYVTATFSSDAIRVVTAGFDNSARVWDSDSGELLVTLVGHAQLVTSASYSSDGLRIVSGSDDNTARVWDAESGQLLNKLVGHTNSINSAEFSPDGARVVTASDDDTARVWDAETGAHLVTLEGHERDVYSARFSPDGDLVVTAGDDGTARVWYAGSGRCLATLKGHTRWLIGAQFSSSGTRILTWSADGTARLWDASSGELLVALQGHTQSILSAQVSPDETRVITASWDRSARIWDAGSGLAISVLEGHTANVNSASFSWDGKQVVTASTDGSARLWDVNSGGLLAILEGHVAGVGSAALSRDGTRVVTASWDGTARIWDTSFSSSGSRFARLEKHPDNLTASGIGADGTRMIWAFDDNIAYVWDASSGSELARLKGHSDRITFTVFSADGTRILTTSNDGTWRVWDLYSGIELMRIDGLAEWVVSAAFNSDGSRVLAAFADGSARVWNSSSGDEVARFVGSEGRVSFAAFSPPGTHLIASYGKGPMRMWDIGTGAEIAKFEGDGFGEPVFSPDGKMVAAPVDDRTACVWDARSGRPVATLIGHTLRVTAAGFSPDGARVVTTSDDGTARIWETSTGIGLVRLKGHCEAMYAAAFSQDGTCVITESDEGIAVWDTVPYRRRFAEHKASLQTVPAARQALDEALATTSDLVLVGSRLRERGDLDARVRRAACDLLLESAQAGRRGRQELEEMHARRRLIGRLLEPEVVVKEGEQSPEARETESGEVEMEFERQAVELAAWRDENGALRVDVLREELDGLERRIAELEADPWVRRWIASQRVR